MEKKKIVIFEDSERDLVNRYKIFNNENYETFVYLNCPEINNEKLVKEGFNKVYQGLPKKLFSENFLKDNLERFIDLKEFYSKLEEYKSQGKFGLVSRLFDKTILNEENLVEADFYCSDGLNELCFEIVKTFPKEKVLINSGDVVIKTDAIKKGYKIELQNLIFKNLSDDNLMT